MWNDINNCDDVAYLMDKFSNFHDSCIKEFKYMSGAYVDDDLSMYPVNDKRELLIFIQFQRDDIPAVELRFKGVEFFKIYPVNENYTCEILGAVVILKNNAVVWCDREDATEISIDEHIGTVVCASKMEWRAVDKNFNSNEIYCSILEGTGDSWRENQKA